MTALLLVDIQNDFLPGGTLAVPEGGKILPAVHELLKLPFDLIVASQDFHPPGHSSFLSAHPKKEAGEILWPDHCVQGTKGAELEASLPQSKIDKIFLKGTDPKIDSYSAFFDNQKQRATGLGDFLKKKGIARIAVVGLATDYCVLWSVLDALELRFEVDLIEEGCRGIDLKKGDNFAALKKMEEAGAHLFPSVTSYRRFRYDL